MRSNHGFIFFMTLCLIAIVSTLVLTCLHHLLLYHKALNKQELRHQRFYQLEHIALQLVTNPDLVMVAECIQFDDSANKVMNKLIDGQGCLLNADGNRYRYFMEDLGDFPCLVLQEKKKRASHHLRLSLLLEGKDGFSASGLQIRFIKPGGVHKCEGKKHIIFTGISSWRYLSLG